MAKTQAGQYLVRPAWSRVGERGLRLATGPATLASYEALISKKFDEIEDIIPADGSMLLVLRPGAEASGALWATLDVLDAGRTRQVGRLHTVVVEYGGDAGPDLSELAARAGLAESAYIASHAAVEYSVAFLGFQPGFPYLSGLPEALQTPRRASPRVHVKAGSVAVGGAYAGIYPIAGPGGWHIIGRTRAVLFDPCREPPTLLLPGDRLRFVPQ